MTLLVAPSLASGLMILLTLLLPGVGVKAQQIVTMTLQPDNTTGKDAFVHSKPGYEDRNFGPSASFEAMAWTFSGAPGTLREYFDFDLSPILTTGTAVRIESAQLDLFGKTQVNGETHSCLSGQNDFVFRRVTSNWTEDGVTWNNQPTTTSTNELLAAAICTPNANVSFEFTQLVQDYVADPGASFGFQMALQVEEYYRLVLFHSSDSDEPLLRPRLTVSYEIMSNANVTTIDPSPQTFAPATVIVTVTPSPAVPESPSASPPTSSSTLATSTSPPTPASVPGSSASITEAPTMLTLEQSASPAPVEESFHFGKGKGMRAIRHGKGMRRHRDMGGKGKGRMGGKGKGNMGKIWSRKHDDDNILRDDYGYNDDDNDHARRRPFSNSGSIMSQGRKIDHRRRRHSLFDFRNEFFDDMEDTSRDRNRYGLGLMRNKGRARGNVFSRKEWF